LIWRTQLGSITLSLISGKGRINHLFVNHVKADSTEVAYCNILQSPDNNKYIILVRSGDNGFDLFKVTSSGKISFLMNTRTEYNFLIKDELIGIDQNSYDTPQNKEKTDELTGAQAVSGGLKDEWQLRKLIVAYNIEANIKRVLLNLNKRDDIVNPIQDVIDIIASPDKKKILVVAGTYESGSHLAEKYFTYDITNDKIQNYAFPMLRTKKDLRYKTFSINDYCLLNYKSQQLMTNDYLLDNSFQSIGLLMQRDDCKGAGFPLDVNQIFFYFRSNLDRKQRFRLVNVLISYKPIKEVEFNIFRIYNDSLVNKKDFPVLNKDDLLLLKNMVFAKHNYKFDMEYYQAFFNLFSFYNSDKDRQKRTKEVNHLLTEMDKKNLQLIDFALSKLKK